MVVLVVCGLDWLVDNKDCFASHPPGGCLYKGGYSMDANKHFSGSFVVLISFRKPDVSLRYEGSFLMCGCNHPSTKWDTPSDILLQLDMIGLIPSIHPLLHLQGCGLPCFVFSHHQWKATAQLPYAQARRQLDLEQCLSMVSPFCSNQRWR